MSSAREAIDLLFERDLSPEDVWRYLPHKRKEVDITTVKGGEDIVAYTGTFAPQGSDSGFRPTTEDGRGYHHLAFSIGRTGKVGFGKTRVYPSDRDDSDAYDNPQTHTRHKIHSSFANRVCAPLVDK